MAKQVIGRRSQDGGMLPTALDCCSGVRYSYIALGDTAEDARVVYVEQHELWCFLAR